MSYIESKYKGRYRRVASYDESTNDYPRYYIRDEKGNIIDSKIDKSGDDVFVLCKGSQGGQHKHALIYSMGSGLLRYFVESLGRLHNIMKVIESDHPTVYKRVKLYEYDGEGEIEFRYGDSDEIMYLFKPLTSCKDRSAYSTKNLPSVKYEIPKDDDRLYKAAIDGMELHHMNKIYSEFANTHKIDMNYERKKTMLDNKAYIHSLGKWNELVDFISVYRKNL